MLLLQGQHASKAQGVEIIYANRRVDIRMTDELALHIGYRYVGVAEAFVLPLPNICHSLSSPWSFILPMSYFSSPR